VINLLPGEYRHSLKTARLSSQLRRWLFVLWAAIAGLVIIMVVGWFYINQQSKNLTQDIANTNAELTDQNLGQVQKDTRTLTGNIKIINQVLGREIRFSDLIQDIGKVMPNGTILDSLTLSQVSGAIDLSASAKDYNSAAQIAINLSDPQNQIFNKVDIVTISCTGNGSSYPCNGSFKALFSKTTLARYQGAAGGAQ